MSDSKALDPVTFEVLKNSFITSVDQMAEQMLRTCYSFVIYNRDFSNALHDAEGNSVAQGNDDIAVHVGTLHFTCKDVIRVFKGDMMPGDIYAINDPYAGGTHFSDVRLVRPIFDEDELIGFSQSNGHWSDLGGSVPGSFDVTAKDMFREAVRITPVRLFRAGDFCSDVANLIANNTRDPASIIGDIHSQAQATQVAEREILRLVRKYGREQVKQGMNEVQDYVERAVRQRIAALPDGTWKSVDYIDRDPSGGEGMIPIHIKMTIKGDQIHYDFEGSHPTIGSMYNSAPGATFSAVVAGMKTFFPDLPLNSGFYRMLSVAAPENSVVSAQWPTAVTGFLMPFEKIMNSVFEMWSEIMPERAIACWRGARTSGARRTLHSCSTNGSPAVGADGAVRMAATSPQPASEPGSCLSPTKATSGSTRPGRLNFRSKKTAQARANGAEGQGCRKPPCFWKVKNPSCPMSATANAPSSGVLMAVCPPCRMV